MGRDLAHIALPCGERVDRDSALPNLTGLTVQQKLPVAASRSGGAVDQSDPSRLGAVVCSRARQRVLLLHQRPGGKED